VEDWRSLRLDIQVRFLFLSSSMSAPLMSFAQRDTIHTIQEALVHITHPQHIQMAHSSRPDVTIDASQRVLIDALPPILVLHVKRFCYDTSVGGVVKVMKQVWFGPELEIGRGMCFSVIMSTGSCVLSLWCRYDGTKWETVTTDEIPFIRR